jgi:hypothetical protein
MSTVVFAGHDLPMKPAEGRVRVDRMAAMLGRVESVSGKIYSVTGGQFRARLLECSKKAIYNPQAEVYFSHVAQQSR